MTATLQIQLLGIPSFSIDGKPLKKFPSRAAEAIIAFLALSRQPVLREQLIDLIWESSEPKQASANLRSILSPLRRALGPFLAVDRAHVALQASDTRLIEVDALQFLNQTQRLSELGDSEVEQALALYRGEFMKGFRLRDGRGFAEWMAVQRERIDQLAIRALARMVQVKLNSADYGSGIHYARQWLQIDPYSENAHRQLMWLLMRDGQRNAALRQFLRCRDLLLADIGVEPTAATVALYHRLRTLPFPAVNHLPLQSTTFVGRQQELATLFHDVTQPHRRLLTLLGVGGIGKTRLAVAFAERLASRRPGLFLHGVHFVPLAAISQAAHIVTAIADALDLRLTGDDSAENLLIAHLRDHELLLILDNFEQFATNDDALNLVARLLNAVPGLRIVVTSRVRLQLVEESVYHLDGLALPATQNGARTLSPAVQLFVDRAQQVNRHVSFGAAQIETIASTCRLVEGTPLAIELAASNLQLSSLSEISAQIAHTVAHLATTYRNVPARHRSLRAVFEHSWHLLKQHEKSALARLSVFPDSFDDEAAQAVAQAAPAVLSALRNKSLLQAPAEARFAIHPLLRTFSAENLAPDDQTLSERRFINHFIERITAIDARQGPLDPAPLLPDAPNFERMWRLLLSHRQEQRLAPLVDPMFELYASSGRSLEGIRLFSEALAHFDGDELRLALRLQRGRLYTLSGNLQNAVHDLETAQHTPLLATQPLLHSRVLASLAVPYMRQGKLESAKSAAQQSLALAEACNDRQQIAGALNVLGGCHKMVGEFAAARASYERVIQLRHALGDELSIGRVLNNLGNVAQVTGAFDAARRHYREASDIFRAHDRPLPTAVTTSNAGRLAWQMGDLVEARRYLGEAVAIRRALPTQSGLGASLINLALVAVDEGNVSESAELLLEALALSERETSDTLTLEIAVVGGHLLHVRSLNGTDRLLATVLSHPALTDEVRQMAMQFSDTVGFDAAQTPPPFTTLKGCTSWLKQQLTPLLASSIV